MHRLTTIRPWTIVRSRRTSLLIALLSLSAVTPLLAIEEGETAPPFRLPLLVEGGVVDSDSLFTACPFTLLIIWNTECLECLADVVEVSRTWPRIGGDDTQLVGISTDTDRVGDARRVVRGAHLGFLNLWDGDRTVARSWGALDISFSAFLVDSTSGVRLVHHDHPESVVEVLDLARAIVERARGDRR